MQFGIDTKMVFLLGTPLRQSIAARIHNTYYERTGTDMVYMPVEVQSEADFDRVAAAARVMNLAGLAVTKPFKVSIMRHLDEVDELAAKIGSCNTVVIREGRWKGYNTDGIAALCSLREDLGFDPAGSRVFCYGAGGTARSVCLELAAAGAAQITLSSRSALCEELAAGINVHYPGVCRALRAADADMVKAEAAACGLVINLSGVGMGKSEGLSPADPAVFSKGQLAFDAIYGPPKSRFLADAEAKGARILNGHSMFLGQGARQATLWLGDAGAMEVMAQVLKELFG